MLVCVHDINYSQVLEIKVVHFGLFIIETPWNENKTLYCAQALHYRHRDTPFTRSYVGALQCGVMFF